MIQTPYEHLLYYALHTDVICVVSLGFNLKLKIFLFTFIMKFSDCPTYMHLLGAILKCMQQCCSWGPHKQCCSLSCLSPPSAELYDFLILPS